jgi:hypothetical protein
MRAGKRQIWMSSILLAEIRPSMTTGNIVTLHRALESEFNLVGPSPDIMKRAARLRDHSFKHYAPQATEKSRAMSVADAIHLATCLHIKEARGRTDIRFQTFDDGKTKNYEEKGVSLLRLEEYAKHLMEHADVKAACELIREKPIHQAPQLQV